MKQRRARWRVVATAVTLSVQFTIMLTPVVSYAQTSGTQRPPVQRGQEYYEQSRFDEAITLLRDLVDRDQLSGETLQKARELLARSYVKKGYPVQAKEMFKAILRVTPDWRPDPIKVPPDETAVFDQALKEFQTEQVAPPPPPPPPVKQETAGAARNVQAGAGQAEDGPGHRSHPVEPQEVQQDLALRGGRSGAGGRHRGRGRRWFQRWQRLDAAPARVEWIPAAAVAVAHGAPSTT